MASRCWVTNVSSILSCFCSVWQTTVRGHRRKNSKTSLIPHGRAAIYRSALAIISTSRSVIKCAYGSVPRAVASATQCEARSLPLAVLIRRAFPYTQSQTALTFKRFPDPFNAPPRAEFQHQFDPRFMARQHSAKDRAHLSQLASRAFVSVSIEHAPARAARRDDDRKAGLDRALDGWQGGDSDVAAAEAFDHQPARAVVDREIDEAPVRPGGHLDHVDALFDPVRDDVFAPF